MRGVFVPLLTLITPNLPEADLLLGSEVQWSLNTICPTAFNTW
ncbi:hypothetical protein [Bartonella rattaustraliani]